MSALKSLLLCALVSGGLAACNPSDPKYCGESTRYYYCCGSLEVCTNSTSHTCARDPVITFAIIGASVGISAVSALVWFLLRRRGMCGGVRRDLPSGSAGAGAATGTDVVVITNPVGAPPAGQYAYAQAAWPAPPMPYGAPPPQTWPPKMPHGAPPTYDAQPMPYGAQPNPYGAQPHPYGAQPMPPPPPLMADAASPQGGPPPPPPPPQGSAPPPPPAYAPFAPFAGGAAADQVPRPPPPSY
jgi:hypothetical protein